MTQAQTRTGRTDRGEVLRFGAVWTTSVISGVGSGLTTFVFGVWILLETGSPTLFAIAMLCAFAPGILLGPISGVVVDRFNRRWVLIMTDAASAVAVAVIAYLIFTDQVQVWHLYLATLVSAAGGTFHMTAYSAMTPLLIPKRHLARANGLMQVAIAAHIAAPLLAAAMLPVFGFAGVLVLDLVTFAVAVTTLLAIRLPARILWAEQPATPPPLRQDLIYGWRHLSQRSGLRPLVLVMVGYNLCFASAGVLVQPLILSFASYLTLGVLMFVGGSGMFAGSIVMGLWGGPRRRVRGMAVFIVIGGLALIAHTPRPSVVLVGMAAFAFLFTLPVVNALFQTTLQVKVEPAGLGRVMGTAQMLARLPAPVAYLLAAPVAEYAMEPAMQPGGGLAGSLGQLIGTGPGRGIAAVILIAGVLLLALGLLLPGLPVVRQVDTHLPDILPDTPDTGPDTPATGPATPDTSDTGPATSDTSDTGPATAGSAEPAAPQPERTAAHAARPD